MGLKVVVAEDSYLIREGLRSLLSGQDELDLVAAVSTLPELLAAVRRHAPDVVVTDVRMPPGDSDEGVRAAESFAREYPELGVVVLSQYVEPEWALRLFDPSAVRRAYLLKERVGDVEHLGAAIRAVAGGGSMLDPAVVQALVGAQVKHERSPLSRLTPREKQVLGLMATGLSNAAIAGRLVLTERAVEKHITSVLSKLDLDPEDGQIHRRVRAVLAYLSAVEG
ncbi:response regulator transcription factor [Kribbella turkmenica]|uniref:Response regulator transcription factor n=1 Tax=Kribbella turkmenica TaxID=2530375 RepID=A0A4V2YCV6_9ACTN|nr:response regulator transcription factor [Kribbella turkmenica]